MRWISACILLLLLAPLAAQDKKPVDLAVGYPSTTLIYGSMSLEDLGDLASLEEALQGMGGDVRLPDISALVAEKLELRLSKQELRDLASGTKRVSAGVLDIAVKGPKLQFVFEHKDLSPLYRALAKAAKEGKETVTSAEDYDGVKIFGLYFPISSGPSEGMLNEINPFRGWFDSLDIHAAILDNKYLVLAASASSCKDAIDGLLFPEDPADTLLGNKRYTEALKDFDKPAGALFVNVQAVINTIERLSGDKGSSPILDMMLREIMPGDTDAAFWASLTQYEQFKSFAAALWLPQQEGGVQGRMEARLSFHNAPGWLDALRVPAKPMPMLDLMPEDTISANTACIDDVGALYARVKEFFVSRAREAGKTEIIDEWDKFEKKAAEEGVEFNTLFGHIGLGQAWITLPTSDDTDRRASANVGTVGLLGLKDWRAAQDYFYEKLLPSIVGEPARKMESDLSPVEVIGGIEIHSELGGSWAFAFIPLPGDNKQGVFAVGDTAGLRRLATMRQKGRTLANSPTFANARGGMWQTQNLGLYLNVGAMLKIMAETFESYSSWGFDEEWGDEPIVDRDDAEKDRNPVPKLADFFSKAVLVGGTRSADTVIEMRFCAAGVPPMAEFKQLARHYGDVSRNFEVRDDLLRVRQAAVTHLVMKAEPATDAGKLIDAGYLAKLEWAIDPYGKVGDQESTLRYLVAPVPKDVDIRQAVLLAYQAKPGLRGEHLAILWNNHVVSLTPAQLATALERAAKGERLTDGMYSTPLKPLHEIKPAAVEDSWDEPDVEPMVEVVVIDDEGNESTIEVPKADVAAETERRLNEPAKEEEDE